MRSVDVASVPSEQDNNLPGASDHPTDDVELEQSTAITNDEYAIIDETGSTGGLDTSLSEETICSTSSFATMLSDDESKAGDEQNNHIVTIPANDFTDITDAEYHDINHKFGENNTVQTILCGGKVLERISLDSKVVAAEEVLKIANGNATLKHSIDTIKFFIAKRHKRVKNVLLQISTNHID